MEGLMMAKPKIPAGGGKDDGKTGKHHGGYLHGNAKAVASGKHVKGGTGKGGGKK
jgi:hypothetical protein